MKLIPRPRWRAEARLQIQPHADPIRSGEPRNVLIDYLAQKAGNRRPVFPPRRFGRAKVLGLIAVL